ncbi:mRNA (2'-O-methyladenosine-N(6)-)-methyltransferase isoform X1 [Choloepus didactylus]|uniref:mRNA (2'-O-methyladenosine-N(6)-)-methyltransferase isoform X1 n=1 Tax=Choloepus didactylus TaxID=27675 RepID=UPI00189E0C02|nr:mRNA (2'-O-methyladenosine-N(6)-)-methyltransferase isoform X1 [Choloepus didactylus]XP_037667371.1 mRNA (2'-O-methyladenosine-N(6)-)-methyltransferase isoform X1 [Choloepus didactylus]XP_037667372.1 mRNA (2'-O-methyladenosine-N(6)-)-methyltransferase isoform X1 [Choloepus didactylus]XP_037667373.1 mRNA (2'-O-methyladenosine-N(6)-)-methyltransferase isoform X1 [Choloepus didactylus]
MANENHGSPREEASLLSHSPGTSNQSQPCSPKPIRLVQDLPEELVHAGWEKCWSRRENRPYYFNRFTNQSLWEMPVLGQHDVISDPLGLNATPLPQDSSLVETPPAENKPRKRQLSEEQPSGNGVKKPKIEIPVAPMAQSVPSSPSVPGTPTLKIWGTSSEDKQQAALLRPTEVYWDLDIQTNAVIKHRGPSEVLPPHPEVELLRSQLILKLRQHYRELCQQREGIEPPRESFNRWMLERKVVDKGSDPLLPSNCEPIVSPSMFREIMNDIPIRLSRIKFREEAKRLLFKYAEAARRLIESRSASPDSRKVVKWNVEDTFSWLRKDHSASKEDYMTPDQECLLRIAWSICGGSVARMSRLQPRTQWKASVARSTTSLSSMSSVSVRSILPSSRKTTSQEVEAPEVEPRLVYCYPVRLAVSAPPMPSVEMHMENNVVCIRYKGEMVKVSRNYFSKLWLLYRYSCIDDSAFERFLPRVWCLLRRYQMMFGVGLYEGTGLQGSLPVHVFEALHRLFGVSFECFASPLNCYFRQYCSAFPDTDGYFGSRGPCLDFSPLSGSFEANPPFCEELMDAMVSHFERLLESSLEPLSFIVFIPEWREPPTPALTRMEQSRFKRHQLVLPAFEHEYRSGSQHVCKKEEMHYKAVHNTAVLFLQNDPGFAKWGPTPARLQDLSTAYRQSARSHSSGSSSSSSEAKDRDLGREQGPSREPHPT